jgi:hypothetical protein
VIPVGVSAGRKEARLIAGARANFCADASAMMVGSCLSGGRLSVGSSAQASERFTMADVNVDPLELSARLGGTYQVPCFLKTEPQTEMPRAPTVRLPVNCQRIQAGRSFLLVRRTLVQTKQEKNNLEHLSA